VLENVDDRKSSGRVAHEMESFFEEPPDAGFCLDVAHVRSIDPTMDAANELLDRFRSRLRHVHLSSLEGGRHPPLTEETKDCSPRSWTAAGTCLGSSKLCRLTGGRRR
jgi:sugar phosphate isomerase/epimerase